MDAARFDALARRLGASPYRCSVLGLSLGGVVGSLVSRGRTMAAKASIGATPAATVSICATTDVPDLQRREPGDLVASEEITPHNDPSFPPGARAWRVLYVSTGRDNTDRTLVCGVIIAPSDPTRIDVHSAEGAMTGRVVAWSHGTLGVVQRCQPSESPAQEIWGPPPFGINQVAWGSKAGGDAHAGAPEDGILAGMIDKGWIVAATDYASHLSVDDALQPFVIGKIEAANVIDSIRAAHILLARVFEQYTATAYDVITWGHSQGGHAAMWAGQLLSSYEAATKTGDSPALALAGVALEAPASNFLVQPDAQANATPGYGLLDWTTHAKLQLTGQPEAIPLAPFFFSYIFEPWARQSAGGSTDASAMPAYPDAGPLDVSAVVTTGALPTVESMTDYCWADGEEVATLAAPYATTPFVVPALADGPVLERMQHGNFDQTCAGDPSPEIAKWCEWFRYNNPGPLGVNPFDKLPTRSGRPVPVLITAGANDGVVHCVAPDPTADAIPQANDCAPVALYDALRAEYCSDDGDTGHLSLLIWRKEDGVTIADHSSVTGLIAAASTTDPRFQGSPLERFFSGAFAGTLAPGCSAAVANKTARAQEVPASAHG